MSLLASGVGCIDLADPEKSGEDAGTPDEGLAPGDAGSARDGSIPVDATSPSTPPDVDAQRPPDRPVLPPLPLAPDGGGASDGGADAAAPPVVTPPSPSAPLRTDVYYLTNCSGQGVVSSQMSWYADVEQSKSGERPGSVALLTPTAFTTWEGAAVSGKLQDQGTFVSQITDHDGPEHSQKGGGSTPYGRYACFQDSQRLLYRSGEQSCYAIYYCMFDSFSKEPQPGRLSLSDQDRTAVQLGRVLMRDLALSKEQVLGVLGNLFYLSMMQANLNQEYGYTGAGLKGPGAPSSDLMQGYGWAQWTGERKRQFLEHSKAQAVDPASVAANYGFLRRELEGSHAQALAALRGAKSVDEAVELVLRYFEGGDTSSLAERRMQAARLAGKL